MPEQSKRRLLLLVAAVLAVAVGAAALGGAFGGRKPNAEERALASSTERALAGEVAALREELREERSLREAMRAEIEALWRELRGGSPGQPADGEASDAVAADGPTQSQATAAAKPLEAQATAGATAKPAREWFDEDRLVETGFDPGEASWLRDRFEELQMEELYARDEARRASYLNTPRFYQEIRALRAEAREEIGDEAYDALLYGAGRPNRVLASDVLRSSPAAAAGIQAGDVVVRYDGQDIFSGLDLRAATSQGKAGASVPVDVLREGRSVRVYVSRGPLGVRLRPTRQAPDPAG